LEERTMTKKNLGLVLFWLGLVWAFFWGILASIHQVEFYIGVLTFDELNETIWAITGPLMAVWGLAPPLGALVAGVGLLLYSGVETSTVLKSGIGVFLAVIASFAIGSLGHFPPLYAIGGTLILLFFFGILWLWATERMDLRGQSATAADLRLVGYVFMVIAAWFTCGIAGTQWLEAFADQPPMMEPITVMIFFVLGWLFLFLSHYESRKRRA
jgi:hypothetical protein